MGIGNRATPCLFEAILKVVPLSARSLTQRLYDHRNIFDLEQKTLSFQESLQNAENKFVLTNEYVECT